MNKVHSIRRFSVHPVNRSRHVHGEYHHLIPVFLDDPFKFAEYLRMNPDTFHDLLEIQGRIGTAEISFSSSMLRFCACQGKAMHYQSIETPEKFSPLNGRTGKIVHARS